MSTSDIKDCGRGDVHEGHHWYEPIERRPLTAYGVQAPWDDAVPPTRLWYCRGDSGMRQFRVTVVIEPEPGTPGPFGGTPFRYQGTIPAEVVMADVEARADSVQTALELFTRGAAQGAVWRYHEAMIKELDEAEGRPYLDEGARARQRMEERQRMEASIRLCAYCGLSLVRIEPQPGYSEWTSDTRTTAGQSCPHGPNGFHAPQARQAREIDPGSDGW